MNTLEISADRNSVLVDIRINFNESNHIWAGNKFYSTDNGQLSERHTTLMLLFVYQSNIKHRNEKKAHTYDSHTIEATEKKRTEQTDL